MGSSVGAGSAGGTTGTASVESEDLQETMRWPYEEEDLLDALDNEELPLILVDLIESKYPNLFYSGCVIAEVRDYRQSFPISTCDTYHVLLKPTNQTMYADINLLTAEGDWSPDERLALESQVVMAASEPLCLDPDPQIGQFAANQQYRRQIFNTAAVRRQAKKFSQVAINRKRKLDQFTHNFGLELSDFMTRYRQRPRQYQQTKRSVVSFTLPKKPTDVVQPIKAPNLDTPPLEPPKEVAVSRFARSYERPSDRIGDCGTQLIEEYILETDRGGGRVYHIKLSIFQRPSNSEYLGELYVDRDYKEGERHGESCRFILGSRSHANRYIQQFTEIFTEEGRKSVKITHCVPGQMPKVTYTAGMREHRIQQQQQVVAAQQQSVSNVVQQQVQQQIQRPNSAAAALVAQLNATNPNTLPGNQIVATPGGSSNPGTTTTNIINLSNLTPQQLQQLQFANAQTVQCDSGQSIQIAANQSQLVAAAAVGQQQQQQQQQNTTQFVQAQTPQGQQININGSLLLVQQSGNLTNLAMASNTQNVNVLHATNSSRSANLATTVPILVRIT